MPERIQRRRTRGWRMPEGAKYVGRPSKWANPFVVGMVIDRVAMSGKDGTHTVAIVRVLSRTHAVECYRRWLDGTPLLIAPGKLAPPPPTTADIRAALGGRDLACWCAIDDYPCHADVLLEICRGAV